MRPKCRNMLKQFFTGRTSPSFEVFSFTRHWNQECDHERGAAEVGETPTTMASCLFGHDCRDREGPDERGPVASAATGVRPTVLSWLFDLRACPHFSLFTCSHVVSQHFRIRTKRVSCSPLHGPQCRVRFVVIFQFDTCPSTVDLESVLRLFLGMLKWSGCRLLATSFCCLRQWRGRACCSFPVRRPFAVAVRGACEDEKLFGGVGCSSAVNTSSRRAISSRRSSDLLLPEQRTKRRENTREKRRHSRTR